MFQPQKITYHQDKAVEEYLLTADEMKSIHTALIHFFHDQGWLYIPAFIAEFNTFSETIDKDIGIQAFGDKRDLQVATKELSRLLTQLKNSPFSIDKERVYVDHTHSITDPRTQYFDMDSFLQHLRSIPVFLDNRIRELEPYRTKKGFSSMKYTTDKIPTKEHEVIYKQNEEGCFAMLMFGCIFSLPFIANLGWRMDSGELERFFESMGYTTDKENLRDALFMLFGILFIAACFGARQEGLYFSASQVDERVTKLLQLKRNFDEHLNPQSSAAKLHEDQYAALGLFSSTRAKQLHNIKHQPDQLNNGIDLDELKCSVTLELFFDPVLAVPCGHGIEQQISKALLEKNGLCPCCREKMTMFTPALDKKRLLDEVLSADPLLFKQVYFNLDHFAEVVASNELNSPIGGRFINLLQNAANHLNDKAAEAKNINKTAIQVLASTEQGREILGKNKKIRASLTPESRLLMVGGKTIGEWIEIEKEKQAPTPIAQHGLFAQDTPPHHEAPNTNKLSP